MRSKKVVPTVDSVILRLENAGEIRKRIGSLFGVFTADFISTIVSRSADSEIVSKSCFRKSLLFIDL